MTDQQKQQLQQLRVYWLRKAQSNGTIETEAASLGLANALKQTIDGHTTLNQLETLLANIAKDTQNMAIWTLCNEAYEAVKAIIKGQSPEQLQ